MKLVLSPLPLEKAHSGSPSVAGDVLDLSLSRDFSVLFVQNGFARLHSIEETQTHDFPLPAASIARCCHDFASGRLYALESPTIPPAGKANRRGKPKPPEVATDAVRKLPYRLHSWPSSSLSPSNPGNSARSGHQQTQHGYHTVNLDGPVAAIFPLGGRGFSLKQLREMTNPQEASAGGNPNSSTARPNTSKADFKSKLASAADGSTNPLAARESRGGVLVLFASGVIQTFSPNLTPLLTVNPETLNPETPEPGNSNTEAFPLSHVVQASSSGLWSIRKATKSAIPRKAHSRGPSGGSTSGAAGTATAAAANQEETPGERALGGGGGGESKGSCARWVLAVVLGDARDGAGVKESGDLGARLQSGSLLRLYQVECSVTGGNNAGNRTGANEQPRAAADVAVQHTVELIGQATLAFPGTDGRGPVQRAEKADGNQHVGGSREVRAADQGQQVVTSVEEAPGIAAVAVGSAGAVSVLWYTGLWQCFNNCVTAIPSLHPKSVLPASFSLQLALAIPPAQVGGAAPLVSLQTTPLPAAHIVHVPESAYAAILAFAPAGGNGGRGKVLPGGLVGGEGAEDAVVAAAGGEDAVAALAGGQDGGLMLSLIVVDCQFGCIHAQKNIPIPARSPVKDDGVGASLSETLQRQFPPVQAAWVGGRTGVLLVTAATSAFVVTLDRQEVTLASVLGALQPMAAPPVPYSHTPLPLLTAADVTSGDNIKRDATKGGIAEGGRQSKKKGGKRRAAEEAVEGGGEGKSAIATDSSALDGTGAAAASVVNQLSILSLSQDDSLAGHAAGWRGLSASAEAAAAAQARAVLAAERQCHGTATRFQVPVTGHGCMNESSLLEVVRKANAEARGGGSFSSNQVAGGDMVAVTSTSDDALLLRALMSGLGASRQADVAGDKNEGTDSVEGKAGKKGEEDVEWLVGCVVHYADVQRAKVEWEKERKKKMMSENASVTKGAKEGNAQKGVKGTKEVEKKGQEGKGGKEVKRRGTEAALVRKVKAKKAARRFRQRNAGSAAPSIQALDIPMEEVRVEEGEGNKAAKKKGRRDRQKAKKRGEAKKRGSEDEEEEGEEYGEATLEEGEADENGEEGEKGMDVDEIERTSEEDEDGEEHAGEDGEDEKVGEEEEGEEEKGGVEDEAAVSTEQADAPLPSLDLSSVPPISLSSAKGIRSLARALKWLPPLATSALAYRALASHQWKLLEALLASGQLSASLCPPGFVAALVTARQAGLLELCVTRQRDICPRDLGAILKQALEGLRDMGVTTPGVAERAILKHTLEGVRDGELPTQRGVVTQAAAETAGDELRGKGSELKGTAVDAGGGGPSNEVAMRRRARGRKVLQSLRAVLAEMQALEEQAAAGVDPADLPSMQARFRALQARKAGLLRDVVTASAELDGFTDAELRLHSLVAVPVDDAVLGSVVTTLSPAAAVALLAYLRKWVAVFERRGLTTLPEVSSSEPHGFDLPVPSLLRVVSWASACLDAHAVQLVFQPASLPVLEGILMSIRRHASVAKQAGLLVGPLAYVACGGALPAVKDRVTQNLVKVEVLDVS